MRYLLDTNVISELRKRGRADAGVQAWALGTRVAELATSVLVMAEIRRGILLKARTDGDQAAALQAWYERLASRFGPRVLPVSADVADVWARISVPDRFPVIDGLIAATALVHDLVLVTRNVRDFEGSGAVVLDPFAAGAA